MSDATLFIPLSFLQSYPHRHVVVCAPSIDELLDQFPSGDVDHVSFVRLTRLSGDPDRLRSWHPSIPLDLALSDPAEQFAELYHWAVLLEKRSVRVSIPTKRGFTKAVRLAATLRFEIKLEIEQPSPSEAAELADALDYYLRDSAVETPVEPFHSLLQEFYGVKQGSLWSIQEENPGQHHEIGDDGIEVPHGRLADLPLAGPPENALEQFEQTLLSGDAECRGCPFRAVCRGYFKAPLRHYTCDGVKPLLAQLEQAAEGLKSDIEARRKQSPDEPL